MAKRRKQRSRDQRSDKRRYRQLNREYKTHGEGRNETVYILEGPLSDSDDAIYRKEEFTFLDKQNRPRRVTYIGIPTCTFGHLLGESNKATCCCRRCGAVCCGAPGCAASCSRCGAACCKKCRRYIPSQDGKHVRVFCKRWSCFLHFLFGVD